MPPLLVLGYAANRRNPRFHAGCFALPDITGARDPHEELTALLDETVPELVVTTGALTAVFALHVREHVDPTAPDGIYVLSERGEGRPLSPRADAEWLGGDQDADRRERPREFIYVLGSDGVTVGAGRAPVEREPSGWCHCGDFTYLIGDAFCGQLVPASLREATRCSQRYRCHN
jgi:hypothetical protein